MVAADTTGRAITFGPTQVQIELIGQKGSMHRVLFAPDGRTVATVAGSTVRLWEPYGEPWFRGIHKFAAPATSVVFDPTGKLIASGDADGDVLVQRANGEPLRTLHIGAPIVSLAWAQDGMLLVGAKDGAVAPPCERRSRPTRARSHTARRSSAQHFERTGRWLPPPGPTGTSDSGMRQPVAGCSSCIRLPA